MKTIFFAAGIAFLCFISPTNAQTVPQRSPDSRDVLLKGIEFYDKGEYKEAASLFGSIHRNDTSYMLSLYEKALALQQDSLYEEALANIELALIQEHYESNHDQLLLKANILDDMGKPEEALRLYDSILKHYPGSSFARSQKVTTLYRMKLYDEAELLARECVLMNYLNPLYHYKLGYITWQQGKIIPSMMAMMMAQIVHPSHNNASNVISYLSSICNAKDETVAIAQQRTADYPDNFSRLEQIIFSKIAFDKSYNPKFNLDDNIFKQINVMLEKLEFDENSDDPYMQLYAPFFKQVHADKKAEVMLNHAFSGLKIDAIDTYMRKNKSAANAFKETALQYVEKVRSTRVVSYAARLKAETFYHFDGGRFIAEGKMVGEKAEGYWKFYFEKGQLRAEGKQVDDNREGTWRYYYENGQLQSVEEFKKNLSDGSVTVYYPGGALKKTMTYKDDKIEGVVLYYNLHKVVVTKEEYLNGELHGQIKSYYNDGRLKSEVVYKNGKLDGPYTNYYNNQTIKEKGVYVDGEANGNFSEFYSDGKIKVEYSYQQGKTNGIWKYYHRNGKLNYQLTMTDKGAEGEVIHYDEDGKIESKEIYKEGTAIGTSDYYHDGRMYVSFKNNNKGKTNELRYVDSTGKELVVNKRSGKIWPVTYYSPYGFKVTEKQFDQDEQPINEAVYYNAEGFPVLKQPYADGELNGTVRSWYYNKQLKEESTYKDGKKNGVSKTYFPNGKLSTVAFYDDDVLQDYVYDYDAKGNLSSKYFYVNGEKHGYAIVNYPNGKPFYQEKYSNGWIQELTQYDTLGNAMKPIVFQNGEGVYKLYYPDGKVYYELTLKKGLWEGLQKKYYPDGGIMSEVEYKNDQKEGKAKYYYLNGKLSSEGTFLNDQKNAVWKSYDEEGGVDMEEIYVDGLLHGKAKYYEYGRLTREIEFRDNERNGTTKRYGSDGELGIEIYYDEGLITSYSYLDKNKKLLPRIWLKNLTGTMEAYYSNGTKSTVIEVAAGFYHGAFKSYSEKGILLYESIEEYGNSHGTEKKFHTNGQLYRSNLEQHDITEGVVKEFYPDGKLLSELYYITGNPHGPHKIYDQSGKLKETRIYYYGYIMLVKK
jgi:antitoxin component YwqK of YwqJK toxin-antitoxin module